MQTPEDSAESTPTRSDVRVHYMGEGHIMSDTCWCFPRLEFKDPETGNEVWVHHMPN